MKALIIESDNHSLTTLEILLKQYTNIQIIDKHMALSNQVKNAINVEVDIIFIDYFLSDTHYTNFVVETVRQFPDIKIILMKPYAYHLEENVVSEIQFLSKPIRRYSFNKIMRKVKENLSYMSDNDVLHNKALLYENVTNTL